MAVKHKKRSAAESAAFQRFVELVKPIDAVQHVAATEEGPTEITTYIKGRGQKVYEDISRAEDEIIESFPDLMIEFHVYGIDRLTEARLRRTALIFERQSDG